MSSSVLPLIDLLLKSLVTLAIAAAVTQLWPRASAATKHLVWAASFATLLLLPIARLAVPHWTFCLPGKSGAKARAVAPSVAPVIVRTSVGSLSGSQLTDQSRAAIPLSAVREFRLPNWENLLLAGWGAGALLTLTRRLFGAVRVRALRQASVPVRDERTQTFAALSAETLRVGTFDLRESANCRVPLTWGTWRPVLMLPMQAREWPESQLLAALRHELAHIRRRDHLTRLVTQIACALYWPNPLVWLAARALRTAQEQACDDLVLRAGTNPYDYAAQLFDISQMLGGFVAMEGHAVAMAQPSTLEARIRAIVDNSRNRRPASAATIFAISAGTVAFAALSATAQINDGKIPDGPLPDLEFAAGQQIEVSAEFIELPAAAFDALFPHAREKPGQLAIYSAAEVAELRRKLGPIFPTNFLENGAGFIGNRLFGAPRVTTRDGQRAVIEIIRERRIVGPGGEPQTLNEGITLETEPRLAPDGLHLPLRPKLVKLRSDAREPLTLESFHVVEFQTPDDGVRLRDGEVVVFGGWETDHPGRKVLILAEGRSEALALSTRLSATVLPEVQLTGVSVRQAADHLMQRTASLSITTAPETNEQKVTLNVRNVSVEQALRQLASSAGLHAYLTKDSVHLAGPLPPGAREQADAIILPQVKLTGVLLPEALDKLTALARQQHPEAARLRIERPSPEELQSPPITVAMTNTPFSTAVALVAELAGLQFSAGEQSLIVHRAEARPPDTTRVVAPLVGARSGVARIANEADLRAAENIGIDIQFIDLAVDQIDAAGLTPIAEMPETRAAMISAVLSDKETKDVILRLNQMSGVELVTAPRVKTSSGKVATAQVEHKYTLNDASQTRVIGTSAVTVKPTSGADGQTMDLEIVPWRSERRATDNAPMFSTRKVTTSVSIFAGSTVALVQRDPHRNERAELVLVTVSAVLP